MIRTILALFGYIKVPKEAIILSMEFENGFRIISEKVPKFSPLYESSKVMTNFLRSGKLLNNEKVE